MNRLTRSFYENPTEIVAQELLGTILVRSWQGHMLAGIIAETEAYSHVNDAASHAYKGQTARNKSLFGPAGHTYVYFIYGNHYCLNVTAKPTTSIAGGVLLRSIIPLTGISFMQQARRTLQYNNLANGPGKIGQALYLSLHDNHHDVTQEGPVYITQGVSLTADDYVATPRIGISKAQEHLWRFVLTPQAYNRVKEEAQKLCVLLEI